MVLLLFEISCGDNFDIREASILRGAIDFVDLKILVILGMSTPGQIGEGMKEVFKNDLIGFLLMVSGRSISRAFRITFIKA